MECILKCKRQTVLLKWDCELRFGLDLTLQDKGLGGPPHVDLLDVAVIDGMVADDRARDLRGSGDVPGHSHGVCSNLVKVQVCGCRDSYIRQSSFTSVIIKCSIPSDVPDQSTQR